MNDGNISQNHCPNCGGRLVFSADGRFRQCQQCNHKIAVVRQRETPQEFMRLQQFSTEESGFANMRTAGGRELLRQGVAAAKTGDKDEAFYYLGWVLRTDSNEKQQAQAWLWLSDAIIPFRVSQEQAEKVIRGWLKKGEVKRSSLSPIVGIYLPLWTFDVGGEIRWGGQVKKGDNWVPISGNHLAFSDDVRVPASTRLDRDLAKGFADFDLDGLVAYDSAYLADWPAERHTIPLAGASLQARKQVLQELRRNPHRLTLEDVRNLRLESLGLVVESFKRRCCPSGWPVTRWKGRRSS